MCSITYNHSFCAVSHCASTLIVLLRISLFLVPPCSCCGLTVIILSGSPPDPTRPPVTPMLLAPPPTPSPSTSRCFAQENLVAHLLHYTKKQKNHKKPLVSRGGFNLVRFQQTDLSEQTHRQNRFEGNMHTASATSAWSIKFFNIGCRLD